MVVAAGMENHGHALAMHFGDKVAGVTRVMRHTSEGQRGCGKEVTYEGWKVESRRELNSLAATFDRVAHRPAECSTNPPTHVNPMELAS